MAVLAAGTAFAGTNVSSDITGSEHWTKANSPYHLKQMIHVKSGATLTIDAGVVVASFVADQGSLAVCRGAKIYVNGTKNDPVIMTSAQDVNEWKGSVCTSTGGLVTSITTMGNPKTGKWLARCNDWGNLTILGQGYISAAKYGGLPVGTNTPCPNANNRKQMEGLTAAFPGDPNVMYGGGDDDDDSGSIHYLSLRYGGKVIGIANELNGLSLGGIGRATDIDHVEIMNNVDDGIEIWGGTVNLKYVNIWNIGDDSLDTDEGWRGKAQFGLIVQGYSVNAAQGSGVGDNCFEMDGAEDSNAQPITTSTIYNFTCVGQPVNGDQGTAWRDNARIQYRNCIFMDLGERLIKCDNSDGDGGSGYGYAGTLSWANTWTNPYTFNELGNLCGFNPALLYTVQTSGTLAEMTDCVFFRNLFATAYGDTAPYAGSNTLGVTVAGGSAPLMHNVVPAYNAGDPDLNMPIQKLVRGPLVAGINMLPVTFINPCAANDAVTSYATAPTNDSFFKPANYRGGFSADKNWLESWTAVDAYGMTDVSMNVADGDLNDDGVIDFSDFADFSGGWLQVN
jgi:hypothetical protein